MADTAAGPVAPYNPGTAPAMEQSLLDRTTHRHPRRRSRTNSVNPPLRDGYEPSGLATPVPQLHRRPLQLPALPAAALLPLVPVGVNSRRAFHDAQRRFPGSACLLLFNLNNTFSDDALWGVLQTKTRSRGFRCVLYVERGPGGDGTTRRVFAQVQFESAMDAWYARRVFHGMSIGTRQIYVQAGVGHIIHAARRDGAPPDPQRAAAVLLGAFYHLKVVRLTTEAGVPEDRPYVVIELRTFGDGIDAWEDLKQGARGRPLMLSKGEYDFARA